MNFIQALFVDKTGAVKVLVWEEKWFNHSPGGKKKGRGSFSQVFSYTCAGQPMGELTSLL